MNPRQPLRRPGDPCPDLVLRVAWTPPSRKEAALERTLKRALFTAGAIFNLWLKFTAYF